MELRNFFEKSLEKYGNIDNQVWYRPYYDSNPAFIKRSGKIDYQSLLKIKICQRVKLVRNSFVHRIEYKNGQEEWKKVSQNTFFPGCPDRISAIEKENIPSKYKSVINGTIINNIVNMVNNEKDYKRKKDADSSLPYTIDGVWIVFGNNYDIYEFLKGVFYSLCEDLFIMYTYKNINNYQNLSPDTEVVQRLLCFNAPFSLMHGFLKISKKEGLNLITDSDVFNKKLRKLLIDTIEYAWNLIADEVVQEFKATFCQINMLKECDQKYNSGNINSDIKKWNKKILIPFINDKINEISRENRIANIGLLVEKLMNELLHKRENDKNYVENLSADEISKNVIEESNEIFIEYIMRLTELQYNDTIKREELRYAQPFAFEEMKENEEDGEEGEKGEGD